MTRHVYKTGAAGCGGKATPTSAKNAGQGSLDFRVFGNVNLSTQVFLFLVLISITDCWVRVNSSKKSLLCTFLCFCFYQISESCWVPMHSSEKNL
jgi:hypothetical protein